MTIETEPNVKGMTKVWCVSCEDFHRFTPSAMGIVLVAYQNGEAQAVTPTGVLPMCLADVYEAIPRDDYSRDAYRGKIAYQR